MLYIWAWLEQWTIRRSHMKTQKIFRELVLLSGFNTLVRLVVSAILAWSGASVLAASATISTNTPPPTTPRDFYNAGTRQLRAGKLREAEADLENVLASQNTRIQQP